MAAKTAEGREEREKRVVVLNVRVKAQDLIEFLQPRGEVGLAGRHTHLVYKNEEDVRFTCHCYLLR
jgi:hypothetical protein